MKNEIKSESASAPRTWKFGGSHSMEVYEPSTGRLICSVMRSMMDGEAEANARLIASAPALLAERDRLIQAMKNIQADAEEAQDKRTPVEWDFRCEQIREQARAAVRFLA